jgi:hypothetical protein
MKVVQSDGNPLDASDVIRQAQTSYHQTPRVFRTYHLSYGRRITTGHSCSTMSYPGCLLSLRPRFGYFPPLSAWKSVKILLVNDFQSLKCQFFKNPCSLPSSDPAFEPIFLLVPLGPEAHRDSHCQFPLPRTKSRVSICAYTCNCDSRYPASSLTDCWVRFARKSRLSFQVAHKGTSCYYRRRFLISLSALFFVGIQLLLSRLDIKVGLTNLFSTSSFLSFGPRKYLEAESICPVAKWRSQTPRENELLLL